MRAIKKIVNHKRPGIFNKATTSAAAGSLHKLAFNNAVQAQIITTVSSGKIIMANSAAGKLLGYSK
ncbi:MAG: hypothetical protein ACXWWC_01215, partial [Chitinophagaceae bacterium]